MALLRNAVPGIEPRTVLPLYDLAKDSSQKDVRQLIASDNCRKSTSGILFPNICWVARKSHLLYNKPVQLRGGELLNKWLWFVVPHCC